MAFLRCLLVLHNPANEFVETFGSLEQSVVAVLGSLLQVVDSVRAPGLYEQLGEVFGFSVCNCPFEVLRIPLILRLLLHILVRCRLAPLILIIAIGSWLLGPVGGGGLLRDGELVVDDLGGVGEEGLLLSLQAQYSSHSANIVLNSEELIHFTDLHLVVLEGEVLRIYQTFEDNVLLICPPLMNGTIHQLEN